MSTKSNVWLTTNLVHFLNPKCVGQNQAKAKVLSEEEIEEAWQMFKEKNKLYNCIVHTIGIGPGHNSSILRRIAAATGGQYKAVGTN